MPCLYDYVCYIQDEMVDTLALPSELVLASEAFTSMFDASHSAYMRGFESEEHHCKICARDLLGDKFFFLSGCEHIFCTHCLQEMVTHCIQNGKVAQIVCPESGCAKSLNDLDMKRLGLGEEMLAKYERFSFQAAIETMDDMGWCPLPGCNSVANVEKD